MHDMLLLPKTDVHNPHSHIHPAGPRNRAYLSSLLNDDLAAPVRIGERGRPSERTCCFDRRSHQNTLQALRLQKQNRGDAFEHESQTPRED
jgi:hypothetical protein